MHTTSLNVLQFDWIKIVCSLKQIWYCILQQCFFIWLTILLFHYWFVMGMVSSEVVFWHKATSPATHATNINQSGFASSWWSCTDACLDEGLMLRCRWNLEYTSVDAQLSKPEHWSKVLLSLECQNSPQRHKQLWSQAIPSLNHQTNCEDLCLCQDSWFNKL